MPSGTVKSQAVWESHDHYRIIHRIIISSHDVTQSLQYKDAAAAAAAAAAVSASVN